jgi:hypothetical protein
MLMSNTVKKINHDVRSMVEQANMHHRGTRVVPLGSAFEVARRSLAATEGETFSVRRFRALSDVSDFVSLVQRNKWNSVEPQNTDLLPVAHPATTRKHRMSELAVLRSRARWYADDPRVTDERVGPLLASAFTASKDSPEYEYAVAALLAMDGQVPPGALLAAFKDGANRGFWRMQIRDKNGRFTEMGGGFRALVRRMRRGGRAGGVYRMNGAIVSTNSENNTAVIQRGDGQLVRVPAAAGEAVKAFVPSSGESDGFSREPVSVGSDATVLDEADLEFVDAPDGFNRAEGRVAPDDEDAPEVWLDDLENYEVAKVRDGEFIVSRTREDGESEPFAVVSSWAEAQRVIREDEPRYRRGEDPELTGELEGVGRAELPSAEEAELADIDENRRELSPEEIAAGFNFSPEGDGQWDGGESDGDGRLIVQSLPNGRWNIAEVVGRDPFPEMVDREQFDNAYDAFEAANDMRQNPLDFDPGMVFDLREGQRGEDGYRVDRGEYEPAGPDGEVESEDYTDDPADLATRFEPEVLSEALEESVRDGSGIGRLEFEEGDEDVPSEAIYNALKEQGADVDSFLDEVEAGRESDINLLGGDDDLPARVAEPRARRNEDAVALRELLGDDLPALLQGLNDRELQEIIDNNYNYRDYVAEPENIDAPDGFYKVEEGAVDPERDIPGAPEGFQPFQFAVEFDGSRLEEGFRAALRPDADRPGYASFDFPGDDGEPEGVDVPAEVIFDALELHGIDANELIREIYGEDEPTPEQVEDALEGEGEEPIAEGEDVPEDLLENDPVELLRRAINGEDIGQDPIDVLRRALGRELSRIASEPQAEPDEVAEVDADEPPTAPPPPSVVFPSGNVPEGGSSGNVQTIDVDGDIRAQVERAIENGDRIRFFYRDKVRIVTPLSVWDNPRNGNVNLYGADETDEGNKKNFTLDRMERIPDGVDEPSVPDVAEAPEADADADEQAIQGILREFEERQRDLLRSEGRDRNNLPPIPERYRRQVYIRLLAGLYADERGNPLAEGDRVIHRRPDMQEKYGEGVVVGKVQGKVGGLQRAGVVYVDYVLVQFPGFDEPKKLAARFLRHTDDDVARERFEAEPRINWMNDEEMRQALSERAKKPRKPRSEQEARDQDEAQRIADEVASKSAEDVLNEGAPDFDLEVGAGIQGIDREVLLNAPEGAKFLIRRFLSPNNRLVVNEEWQKVGDDIWLAGRDAGFLAGGQKRYRIAPAQDAVDYVRFAGVDASRQYERDLDGNNYLIQPAEFRGVDVVDLDVLGNAENIDDWLRFRRDQEQGVASEPPRPAEPEAPEVPEAPEPIESAGRMERLFRLNGDDAVFENAERIEGANVRDVQVGDFVQTRKGNFGRVIGLRDVGDRVAIKVQYPNGNEYEYRPYLADMRIDGLWRVPGDGADVRAPQAPAAPDQIVEGEDRRVPVPRIAAVGSEQIAQISQARLDVNKIVRDVGPQNRARGYNDQAFIKYLQHMKKRLNEGNVNGARRNWERAKDILPNIRYYEDDVKQDYQRRLDAMEVLFDNAAVAKFNGAPLEELDPLAVKEQRIEDGVNAVSMGEFWRRNLLGDNELDEFARRGIEVRQFKDELRDFFEGDAKPLAALPENARFGLQALVQDRLIDRNRTSDERENFRELAELGNALQRERLAYEPNDGSSLDARGALLLDFSPQDMAEAARRPGGVLERDGASLGFRVEETGAGGGRMLTNKTYRVVDLTTGKIYYYKTDTNKENIDAELAAVDLARALGLQGVYPAERIPGVDNGVVLGQAGQNVKLQRSPDALANLGLRGGDIVDNGPIQQAFNVMVLDAVMHNNDRHGMNFLVGKADGPAGQFENLRYVPLVIDNGLGQAIATGDNYRGSPKSPVAYIMNPDARVRNEAMQNALLRRLGARGTYEMMQISTQQAIQALRRLYPAGSNPDIDVLVGRLEELRNADLEDWNF